MTANSRGNVRSGVGYEQSAKPGELAPGFGSANLTHQNGGGANELFGANPPAGEPWRSGAGEPLQHAEGGALLMEFDGQQLLRLRQPQPIEDNIHTTNRIHAHDLRFMAGISLKLHPGCSPSMAKS